MAKKTKKLRRSGGGAVTVDKVQKRLAETVFAHTRDKKKAAGRALGTLVEIVTYYLVHAWGLRHHVLIERPIPEFGNPGILHNVEFTLHALRSEKEVCCGEVSLPLSITKLKKLVELGNTTKSQHLLETSRVVRNSCIVKDDVPGEITALHLDSYSEDETRFCVTTVHAKPFALFECKRVGVEDGMRKGPQTIEKAKQGAYVARTVSAIQKVWLPSGEQGGLLYDEKNRPIVGPYREVLAKIIQAEQPRVTLQDMVLTVGVVSNQGNWFTNNDPHKEMRVLAAAYDWLLFLTDVGLLHFVEALLNGGTGLQAASRAFLASYGSDGQKNRFTKVRMDADAHVELQEFFAENLEEIEGWFTVVGPKEGAMVELRELLRTLADLQWDQIHA